MTAKPSLLSSLSEELRSIPLPDGIHWLSDDVPTCVLAHGSTLGYTATFVSWLTHFTPPTGPDAQGAHLYAIRLSFPIWLGNPHRSPDAKTALAKFVQARAAEFQAQLAAHTAIEVHDGCLPPVSDSLEIAYRAAARAGRRQAALYSLSLRILAGEQITILSPDPASAAQLQADLATLLTNLQTSLTTHLE